MEIWFTSLQGASTLSALEMAVVGTWLLALFSARDGNRSGMILACILGAHIALIALYDIIVYSPIPYGWPR